MLAAGRSVQEGEKVVAAVIHYHHETSRHLLPRVAKALRGFRKVSPAKSRMPMLEEIVAGMAVALKALKKDRTALAVVTCASGYFRPCELRQFLTEDLVLPAGGKTKSMNNVSPIVAPAERG